MLGRGWRRRGYYKWWWKWRRFRRRQWRGFWWRLWRRKRGDKFGLGAPTTNADGSPLSDLAGYYVYYGTASGVYGPPVDAKNVTSYTLTGLTPGQTYFIAVAAYDTSQNRSELSDPVSGVAK